MSTHTNPSKVDGIIQSQQVCKALIINDEDPEMKGRYLCKILGAQDGITGDQGKLQWIHPIVNGHAQLRSVGKFPGTSYFPGSTVVLQNLGGDDYCIMGSCSNERNDNNTKDFHPSAQTNSDVRVSGALGDPYKRLITGLPIFSNVLKLFQSASDIMNGIKTSFLDIGNPLDTIFNQAKTPVEFGSRMQAKVQKGQLPSIGDIAYLKGDLLNIQQYMLQNAIPPIIPNALNMLEQLKTSVLSLQNIPMVDSLGGISNILGALQGIANATQQASQGSSQSNAEILKQELYRLYTAETGKQPLNQFGNESIDYIQWETQYLQQLMGASV